ncbi:NfeD family protein [Actomonas aquatica]|uniref:NfeD family protein n=1 Tax=Actomonas aquatica TaxID=2866162 RepID=A0ABZ1CHW3_9BACT|nr:NfeD family protein [Opitutus sp. WL0086]WRQ89850.1 NfeD family protein [Opitutus sp. WL0086]
MTLIVVLFLVGMVLLSAEIILPGGIIGVIGGLAMLAGCVLSFSEFGVGGGAVAVLVAAVIVAIMLWLEFAVLPKTKTGRKLFLNEVISGTAGKERTINYQDCIGKTVTKLAPSGLVEIDGTKVEAFSRNGFLDEDTPIKVVATDSFRVVVIPTE